MTGSAKQLPRHQVQVVRIASEPRLQPPPIPARRTTESPGSGACRSHPWSHPPWPSDRLPDVGNGRNGAGASAGATPVTAKGTAWNPA